jgi:hypothetical protein
VNRLLLRATNHGSEMNGSFVSMTFTAKHGDG